MPVRPRLILTSLVVLSLAGASEALANPSGGAGMGGATSGGAGGSTTPQTSTRSHPTVPGYRAKIIRGVAYAPSMAPIQVKRAIWAGNKIRHKPYIYGGGHGSFKDAGYDCSGSVSFVLHAAGLVKSPMDSSEFMRWGRRGRGHWITVFTNPGHAFVQIAGIRFDTSAEGDPRPPSGSGPRWRPVMAHIAGFMARHSKKF